MSRALELPSPHGRMICSISPSVARAKDSSVGNFAYKSLVMIFTRLSVHCADRRVANSSS